MKKTFKCVLFLTLAVLALFAVTMLGASAATYGGDASAIAAGDVVKVEYTKNSTATTEYYASISAAIEGMGDAIADGATVTVLDDIDAEDAATISAGTVTVIGNDFTATGLALTISGGTVTLDGLNIVKPLRVQRLSPLAATQLLRSATLSFRAQTLLSGLMRR